MKHEPEWCRVCRVELTMEAFAKHPGWCARHFAEAGGAAAPIRRVPADRHDWDCTARRVPSAACDCGAEDPNGGREATGPEWVTEGAASNGGPSCPHSVCSQNYIDTGDAECIQQEARQVGMEDQLGIRSEMNVSVKMRSQNVGQGTCVVNVGEVIRAALVRRLS